MDADSRFLFPGLRSNKILIASELLLFFLILLAWEILKVPKSIIPIFLFCWISIWLRGDSWQSIGLRKPDHLARTILMGVFLGISIQLVGVLLIEPFLSRYLGIATIDPRDLSYLMDSFPLFVVVLFGQWLLAGFGEELVYRGYLLNRLGDLAGQGLFGLSFSIAVSSMLFSLFHGLLGVPFFLLAFLIGVIYSIVYLCSGRNLWITVIAHGTANSIGITLAFIR